VRLIGRDRELGELAAHTGVVGLVGEPGIGKTRLLDALAAHCERWTVLRGAATEFETDVPLAPFAELVEEPAGTLPAER
jgi:predicted ATPase